MSETRYYYAFCWTYGVGTTWEDGSWPGSLMVFDSMAERDAWVAGDVFDGNWHNEAITRYDGSRSAVERYAPIVELVKAWRRIDMQNNPAAYHAE